MLSMMTSVTRYMNVVCQQAIPTSETPRLVLPWTSLAPPVPDDDDQNPEKGGRGPPPPPCCAIETVCLGYEGERKTS